MDGSFTDTEKVDISAVRGDEQDGAGTGGIDDDSGGGDIGDDNQGDISNKSTAKQSTRNAPRGKPGSKTGKSDVKNGETSSRSKRSNGVSKRPSARPHKKVESSVLQARIADLQKKILVLESKTVLARTRLETYTYEANMRSAADDSNQNSEMWLSRPCSHFNVTHHNFAGRTTSTQTDKLTMLQSLDFMRRNFFGS